MSCRCMDGELKEAQGVGEGWLVGDRCYAGDGVPRDGKARQ
jgi:hypothetical protein